MKTAISIPDELFERAEQLADTLEMSRSQLYARAITEFAERHLTEEIRERLDQVYGQATNELDAVTTLMQSLSLPREKW